MLLLNQETLFLSNVINFIYVYVELRNFVYIEMKSMDIMFP